MLERRDAATAFIDMLRSEPLGDQVLPLHSAVEQTGLKQFREAIRERGDRPFANDAGIEDVSGSQRCVSTPD